MEDNTFLTQLQADVIAIASVALAGGVELTRPVPTCPGWSVAELLGHLWSVQAWVRQILRTREVAQEREPTTDPGLVVADFVDGIPDYLTAMRGVNAEEPCWNFGPPPRLAGFWLRRQAHEHAVHRVDLMSALGTEPVRFDPAFAADGVDEILSMFYPRQVRMNRSAPVPDTIGFRAADTGDTWTLGEGDPAAVVTADAADLYLGLWKRIDLLEVSQIDGKPAAVHSALALALTP